MNALAETVEAVWCGDDGTVVALEIVAVWPPADPWAVELFFPRHGCRHVAWMVSRDLLREGLTREVGEGDVRVCPVEPGVWLRLGLSSPDGHAVIELDEPLMATFLHDTYAQIPEGEELAWIAMDDELTALLNGDLQ